MIDLRVETFLKVCETMNYTRAAEELGMTQPSVSQHIRHLEEFYQVKLFIYHNKRLELTEQGAYLKDHLETLSHDVKFMRDAVRNIKKKRHISLGATLSIGEFYIPDMLSRYIKKNPDMEMTVTVADTKDLLAKLDAGEVDFILCEGYFDKNHYANQLIKNEKMCIVCASDYDCDDIKDLPSLFNHHIITREKGSGTREIFENYLREHNYSLDHFARVTAFTSPHLIKKMLVDGHGISVLYEAVVKREIEQSLLKEIAIPQFKITHEFNAVWKENSLYGEEYRDVLEEMLG